MRPVASFITIFDNSAVVHAIYSHPIPTSSGFDELLSGVREWKRPLVRCLRMRGGRFPHVSGGAALCSTSSLVGTQELLEEERGRGRGGARHDGASPGPHPSRPGEGEGCWGWEGKDQENRISPETDESLNLQNGSDICGIQAVRECHSVSRVIVMKSIRPET